VGQIKDTNSTMEVTDNAYIGTPKINQQLGINTDPTQQEWLKQTAQQTTTTTDHLWKNFPRRALTTLPEKDPLVVFKNQFNWP
jgi:hypothetical protein